MEIIIAIELIIINGLIKGTVGRKLGRFYPNAASS
jgi:hypothetical protein